MIKKHKNQGFRERGLCLRRPPSVWDKVSSLLHRCCCDTWSGNDETRIPQVPRCSGDKLWLFIRTQKTTPSRHSLEDGN